jgi:NAD(P)-dependent dehydrogenase (short-subunit alcohol dehydrogenase family)
VWWHVADAGDQQVDGPTAGDEAVGWSPAVAIVTGASAGLGRAYSIELARMGIAVTLVARREAQLRETARLVAEAGGRCEVLVGDVTDPGLADDAVSHTESRLGPVDVLVANAGLLGLGSVAKIDVELWRRVVEVDLVAPMRWNRAVLPGMLARRRGRILNLTSVASLSPQPDGSAYAAAKAGLNSLTASLAAEVASDGVVVVALSPTAHTDMGRELYDNDVLPEARREFLRAYIATDPEGLMRRSLEIFRFVVAGGADALSGQIVGVHPGRSETVEQLRDRAARAAGR